MGNNFKENKELQLIKIVKEPTIHPQWIVENAKAQLYSNCEKLIYKIARKFITNELELQDLVMEGTRGLWIAISKYNIDSDIKLTTYAYWWIQESIRRSIDKDDKFIKEPYSVKQDKKVLRKAQEDYYREHGYNATTDELAKELGWKPNKVLKLLSYGTYTGSYDKVINNDASRETSFADLVKDEKDNAHECLIKDEQMSELSQTYKEILCEQEYTVLAMQQGFNGQKPMSINEIAKACKKSSPRIKQILKQAKDKLANSPLLKEMFDNYKN